MPHPLERLNFPKIIAVLASVLGISIGLCGLTAWLSSLGPANGSATPLIFLGFLELAAILLSAVGLVIMTILWFISKALGNFGKSDDPQKLFDDSDHEKK